MSAPNSYSCLCLDSSVIIAEVVENQAARTRLGEVEKYQKRFKLDIFLPPTVKLECDKRINRLYSYVTESYRAFEREFRVSKNSSRGLQDVELEDLTFIGNFFRNHTASGTELEILKRIEELIVKCLMECLERSRTIPYREFVTEIMIGINRIATGLNYNLVIKLPKYTRTVGTVDPALLTSLGKDSKLSGIVRKKPNDVKILCEVKAHQRTIKKWSILVTLDKNDFLKNANHIEKMYKVICVDPLYIPSVIQRLATLNVQ